MEIRYSFKKFSSISIYPLMTLYRHHCALACYALIALRDQWLNISLLDGLFPTDAWNL